MGHSQPYTYIEQTYGTYRDIYLHRTYIWDIQTYTYIGPTYGTYTDIYLHRTHTWDIYRHIPA
jgi:hypothetical protein